jgi:hypothetical protein
MVPGQTRIICCGGVTIGICAVMVPLPQVEFGNLKVESVQGQSRHGSIPLAVEHLYRILTCPGATGLAE